VTRPYQGAVGHVPAPGCGVIATARAAQERADPASASPGAELVIVDNAEHALETDRDDCLGDGSLHHLAGSNMERAQLGRFAG
jgi:hypothetical protein